MSNTADETITIERTVRIAASRETVWACWTEPKRLVEWWGSEAEVVVETGGLFRVVMEGGQVMRGAFIELDPPRRLVFSFGWEHNAPGAALAPGTTRVEVRLDLDEGDTVLTLRHSEMPLSGAPDHQQGWDYFVGERLVALAATAGGP